MPVLTQTRRRFKQIATVLAVVSGLAALYLLFPIGPDEIALRAQLDAKYQEAIALERGVQPLRNLPQLLLRSEEDRGKFFRERLPDRFSEVFSELGRLATKNGVRLEDVKYESVEVPDAPDLQGLQIEAGLSGRYANVARFINAVERNQMFFLLAGLTLDDEQSGDVRLGLRLETYLRPRTAEDFKREEARPARRTATRTGDR